MTRFQPTGPGPINLNVPSVTQNGAGGANGNHPEERAETPVTDAENAPLTQRLAYTAAGWAPCPMSDGQKEAIPLGVVYDASKKSYVMLAGEDAWIPVTESAVRRHLQQEHGVSDKKPKNGLGSPVDKRLHQVTSKMHIAWSGTMPGYSTGVYSVGAGLRMMVTSSPLIIRPKPGDYSALLTFLDQLLGKDQLPYFHGWLATAYRSLVNRTFVPGQCVVLAGPHGCGKTFVQNHIITPLLGGREGSPYQYMVGKTAFNSDLFHGEHLVMSDQVAHTDLASRREFGSKIKDLLVNPRQRYHAKNFEAHMAAPFWRMTVSTNDEPENLKILPPIDDSLTDKLILLKVCMPECLPATEEGQPAFLAGIRKALPAYAAFLNDFQIPEDLKSGRFGVTHFHNEDILDALDELAPETEMLSLIDQGLFSILDPQDWEGTAAKLYGQLISDDSQVRYEARRIIPNAITCGRYLSRLAKKRVSSLGRPRVRVRLLHGEKLYSVSVPASTDNSQTQRVGIGGDVSNLNRAGKLPWD
jgi:hypothetical protein